MTRLLWSRNGASGYMQSYLGALTLQPQSVINKIDSDLYQTVALTAEINNQTYFTINLPATATVSKFGFKYVRGYFNPGNFEISTSLSDDGVTGYTNFYNVDANNTLNAYFEVTGSPRQCKWIRMRSTGDTLSIITFFVFGYYNDSPELNYKFYNVDGVTELINTDYPLTFTPIGNKSYTPKTLDFKIKNVDSLPHNYTVTVSALKYPSDVVTNYLTLSYGASATPSIQINGIASNDFTNTITLHADLQPAQNPADGIHFFYINVVET